MRLLGKKNLFLLLAVLIFFCACDKKGKETNKLETSAEGSFEVNGKIKGLKGDTVYLMIPEKDTAKIIDKVKANPDGSFTFTGKIEKPAFYRIGFDSGRGVDLVLDDEKFSFIADATEPEITISVEGSKTNEDLQAFVNYFNGLIQQRNQLQGAYIKLSMDPGHDVEKADKLKNKLLGLESERDAYTVKFIDSIFPSKAIFFIVPILNKEEFIDYQYTLSKKLLKAYPALSIAKDYNKTMEQIVAQRKAMEEKAKNSAINVGKQAPDILLPNTKGDTVALSSLKGNYVLLDFWASWCGPCRAENPNVLRMFKKYKDKAFKIYSVSLDQAKEPWLKAIEKDSLQHKGWYHVSDLKYWNSSVVPLYHIEGIPFTLLLDKQGKVIGKNLRGEALGKALEKVLQ